MTMTSIENTSKTEQKLDLKNINPKDLLDAGIHFGHEKTKWNPKMKSYIHSTRKGVHVINIFKTLEVLNDVTKFVKNLSANGGKILMLGTKKQSQQTIKNAAIQSNSSYVVSRWLGGTMTNYQTILKRVKHLAELEEEQKNIDSSSLTKKELTLISKKINKLNKFFEGLKNYKKLPDCLFVVDVKKEKIAINEANILKIPVVGLVDSDSDPSGIDFVIPGNDDSIKSIKLISDVISNSIIEGKGLFAQKTKRPPQSQKPTAKPSIANVNKKQ
jgi:small subunit ribosomal protein S2